MRKLKVKPTLSPCGSIGIPNATAQHFLREGTRVIMTERFENSINQTLLML